MDKLRRQAQAARGLPSEGEALDRLGVAEWKELNYDSAIRSFRAAVALRGFVQGF